METRTITLLAALMLLALSCKKESSTIQSSGINGESSRASLSFDANELAANTVKIGTQVWMKKNLDVTHYRNGDRIPQVKDPVKWSKLTIGAWCWNNNDSANGAIYGRLYNWYAVNDPRGLAPAGWHIPSDAEWDILSTFLGGKRVAGGKMKSTGTIEAGTGLWYAPNKGATNSSRFTGLPGCYRDSFGTFGAVGGVGYWWSSTEFNSAYAWSHSLVYFNSVVRRSSIYERYGFSVRCIRD